MTASGSALNISVPFRMFFRISPHDFEQLSSEQYGYKVTSEGRDVHTITRSTHVSHLSSEMAMVPGVRKLAMRQTRCYRWRGPAQALWGGGRNWKSVRGVVGVFGSPKDPTLHDQTRDGLESTQPAQGQEGARKRRR